MLSAVCGAAQWRGERRRSEGGCGEWLSWMLLLPAPTPQGTLGGEDLGDMGEGGGGRMGEGGGGRMGEGGGGRIELDCIALFVNSILQTP